jgi:DNA-directed RNA polymerase subunit RPC12/RpoP
VGEVLNFKCPCCGAALSFSGKTGEMTCEYCGASFTMEQAQAAQEAEQKDAASSDMTWTTTEQLMITDEDGKMTGYKCPSCKAEMVADENTAATECPYCGNQAIIPQAFEGMYKPDLVVPFAVAKEEAKGKLAEFTKGKKLLPKTFTEGNRIEDITGMYVPFWLYSCHASGEISYNGVKKKTWSDANFEYEKKDHYDIQRSGEMDFARIPVDAATQMDDDTMESLEPYDLSKGVEYNAAYFSGYLANRYDVEEKDAQPRANERVTATFKEKIKESVRGFEEVSEKSEAIQLTNAKAEYAMLPVWMMTTKYNGETYTFGINGQTGKMVGSLPVDKGLWRKYLVIGSVVCFILMQLVLAFVGGFTGTGEVIALILAVIGGLIYVSILKGAMNTVAAQSGARSYLLEKTVKMGAPYDRFLYSKTDKREKSKS